MKRLVILAAAALLAGCSTFHMGGLTYCPYGAACSFQMLGATAAPTPAPPASAASGV